MDRGAFGTSNQDQKRILVIFGATQVSIDQPLAQIQICIEEGYDIFVILSGGKDFSNR